MNQNNIHSRDEINPDFEKWLSLTDNDGDKSDDLVDEKDTINGVTFQVAPGVTVDSEFKRISGEEWPGVKYQATTVGASDDGYDNPIEEWTISKRSNAGEVPISAIIRTPNEDSDELDGDPVEPIGGSIPKEDLDKPEEDPIDPIIDPGETIGDRLNSDSDEELEEPELDIDDEINKLAELYARNRRLLVGEKNRVEFAIERQKFVDLLTKKMEEICSKQYDQCNSENYKKIREMTRQLAEKCKQELLEFAGGDFDNSSKTPEEIANKRQELRRKAIDELNTAYDEMNAEAESQVSAAAVAEYIEMRKKLEFATIEALDDGTLCRKFVSKIMTNKWVRRGVATAAAAGLAGMAIYVGHGIHDGTMAMDVGYTAAGIAAGAGRGALSGGFMARQDSKTSAIRGYGDIKPEDIPESTNPSELAQQSMDDYFSDNQVDLRDNQLKSGASYTVGATIGGVLSGIHVNDINTSTVTSRVKIGETPIKENVDLGVVDVPEGYGMSEVFSDLGGDPSKLQEAVKIATELDKEFGLEPGSNGFIAGNSGIIGKMAHVYPGKIEDWPVASQAYIRAVADKWAANGLIDVQKTGGQPIYQDITRIARKLMRNKLVDLLIRTESDVLAAHVGQENAKFGNIEQQPVDLGHETQE